MNLEDIIISEISDSQKDQYCLIHLYEDPSVVCFTEAESKRVLARDWGRRNEELLFNGYRVPVLQDENVLELDGTSHTLHPHQPAGDTLRTQAIGLLIVIQSRRSRDICDANCIDRGHYRTGRDP